MGFEEEEEEDDDDDTCAERKRREREIMKWSIVIEFFEFFEFLSFPVFEILETSKRFFLLYTCLSYKLIAYFYSFLFNKKEERERAMKIYADAFPISGNNNKDYIYTI